MFTIVVLGNIMVQQNVSDELRQVVQVDAPASQRLQSLSQRIAAAHSQLYLIMTHQAAGIDKNKVDGQMKDLLAEFDSITQQVKAVKAQEPASQQPLFNKLIKQLGDTRSAIDVVGGMIDVDFQTAAGFVAPFEDSYTQMAATLSQAVDMATQETSSRAEGTSRKSQTAIAVMVVIGAFTILIVGALSLISVLTTRRSINQIARATETLAGGDNTVALDRMARKDELGAVVRSLMVFRDNQLHLEQLRAEQEGARATAEQERRTKEAAAAESAREQALVVSSLATGLERLASGDMTYRIDAEFAGDYKKLREDFNGAITQLEDALRVIHEGNGGIQNGSQEISRAADDLSRRTEQQAAALEETAAALDEITATVRKTAEGATHAREVVDTAKNDATQSGEIVHGAVSAMNEIEGSSKRISQIIGVIDEIAFQTNLLALNAGVEAARAGDAGRGFAVVAQEVRALAQRSAEAAKEIKALITASSNQVDQGVKLVGQAGKALERIVAQVAEINVVVAEIAASAHEQSAGLAQVNTAINQMDQVTQQNAAMVEESTAASHSLLHEANDLARLLARFKVSDMAEPQAPVHSTATARTPAPRGERVLRTIGAGRGATAAAVQLQETVEAGWEEF